MASATKTDSGPSAVDSTGSLKSPSTTSGPSAAERQSKEERLIALYMELTGVTEAAARDVYMHLDLNGRQATDLPPGN